MLDNIFNKTNGCVTVPNANVLIIDHQIVNPNIGEGTFMDFCGKQHYWENTFIQTLNTFGRYYHHPSCMQKNNSTNQVEIMESGDCQGYLEPARNTTVLGHSFYIYGEKLYRNILDQVINLNNSCFTVENCTNLLTEVKNAVVNQTTQLTPTNSTALQYTEENNNYGSYLDQIQEFIQDNPVVSAVAGGVVASVAAISVGVLAYRYKNNNHIYIQPLNTGTNDESNLQEDESNVPEIKCTIDNIEEEEIYAVMRSPKPCNTDNECIIGEVPATAGDVV